MSEFRKYGRSPLAGRVKLKHRELGEFYAEDGDISATGLFLKINETAVFAVGDELAAELPLAANESRAPTRLRVVRITNEGVGAAFM
jgi:hypothetical protein